MRKNWSTSEMIKLREVFELYGPKWNKIASHFEDRTNDSIRNRCIRTFFPERITPRVASPIGKTQRIICDRNPYQEEEDKEIMNFITLHGRKFSELQRELPHRTIQALRNRYNRLLRNKTAYANISKIVDDTAHMSEIDTAYAHMSEIVEDPSKTNKITDHIANNDLSLENIEQDLDTVNADAVEMFDSFFV